MNKKILLGIILCFLLIGNVSGELFTFDNVLDYSPDETEATIINFFGLGKDIAKVKLVGFNYNEEEEQFHRYVEVGKDKIVMQMEVENFGNTYANALSDLKIINMNTKFVVEKQFKWVYAIYGDVEVEDKENVCSDVWSEINKTTYNTCSYQVVGTHIENQIIDWIELETTNIPEGNITIGLMTDVKVGDYYDAIPTLFGKEIKEWAGWEAIVMDYIGNPSETTDPSENDPGIYVQVIGDANPIRIVSYATTSVETFTKCWALDGSNQALYEGTKVGNNCTFSPAPIFTNGTIVKLWLNDTVSRTYGRYSSFSFPFDGTNIAFRFGFESIVSNSTTIGFNVIRVYSQKEIPDTDNPAINISSPQNRTYNIPINFSITATDSSGVSDCWVTVNSSVNNFTMENFAGNIYNYSAPTIYSDGGYLAQFYCNDTLGKVNDTESISFTIDTINPDINITYPINLSSFTINTVDVNYTYSDAAIDSCWYSNGTYLVNTSLASCGTNITTVIWADGEHNVTIWANDSAGNENSSRITFTIDATGPVINIVSPINNTNTSNVNLDINYTAIDVIGIGYCWWSNDTMLVNHSLATCGTNITNIIWSEGKHNVTVWANDTIGNENYATVTFSIDTTSPELNVTSPRGFINYHLNGNNLTIVWSVADDYLESCWYDYNETNYSLPCVDGSAGLNVTAYNTNLTFYANDSAGNEISNYTNWSFKVFENSKAYNTSTYETNSETFILNMTTEGTYSVTADFIYNSSNMGAGTKTGSSTNVQFLKTLDVPITGLLSNRTFYWNVTHSGSVINTTSSNQTGHLVHFSFCNATYATPFLNFSFKDEDDLSYINASIPTSTFVYYLGEGTANKTYTFINNTENDYYTFCAFPNRTFYVNSRVQYKSTGYPQRIYNPSVLSYTNSVTNTILYLLNEVDGIYVTFQVINGINQLLSNALVSLSREIESSDVEVASGLTGADGLATFWLNPDFSHDLSVSKSGYTTYSTSIFPTQTEYTITLFGGVVSVTEDYTRGMKTSFLPKTRELFNDTSYDFEFNLTSSSWELDSFGFNLRLANGIIVGTDSSSTEGIPASYSYDVNNQSIIYMDYYWIVEGNTTSGSSYWIVTNTEYTDWSIKVFFTDLSLYLDSGVFGLDNFGRYLITFLILFLAVGIFSYKYGFTSPVPIAIMTFIIVFFLDVVVGLIPAIRGIDYLVTYLAGLLLAVVVIGQVAR